MEMKDIERAAELLSNAIEVDNLLETKEYWHFVNPDYARTLEHRGSDVAFNIYAYGGEPNGERAITFAAEPDGDWYLITESQLQDLPQDPELFRV